MSEPTHQPQDDGSARLIRKAVEGDESALESLLADAGPAVRTRIASKISSVWKSSLDEDDIMQVTYLEAFLEIERFSLRAGGDGSGNGGSGRRAFAAWLTQIAENNLRDAIRGLERAKRPNPKNRVDGGSVRGDDNDLAQIFGMHSLTPSRDAATHEAGNMLEHAIGQLPADYAKVVRLYDLEGKSPEEVASEMGRSAGAVFMLRARAHDRLRRLLGSASRFFSAPD